METKQPTEKKEDEYKMNIDCLKSLKNKRLMCQLLVSLGVIKDNLRKATEFVPYEKLDKEIKHNQYQIKILIEKICE